jgi:AraC-like DNA-binding protein
VVRGLISVHTETGVHVVPDGRLAWIPPLTLHASRSRGPAEGWLVRAPPSYSKRLPDRISVLRASELLLAALGRIGSDRGQAPIEGMLSELILAEVEHIGAERLGLTLPSSPALHRWAMNFVQMPNVKTSIDAAAAATNLSRRSFTRYFAQETGLTWSVWKREVLVQYAIEQLADGHAVAEIAFATGYDNPSAFIAMFKAVRGMSPRRFMRAA